MTTTRDSDDHDLVGELLQQAELSQEQAQRVFDDGSLADRRMLASHTSCPPDLLTQLARRFPAEVVANPAFELHAFAQPTFLARMPPEAVILMLRERSAPDILLSWAFSNERTLSQTKRDVVELICLHPKATRDVLDRSWQHFVAGIHVNSPAAWSKPWLVALTEPHSHCYSQPTLALNEGEPALLASLARHAMFPGDCPIIATIICGAGRRACENVLANHPNLSETVTRQLRRRAGLRINSTGEPAPWYAQDVWRQSASWSEAETAYLSIRSPDFHLSAFLMYASDRLPTQMIVDAARHGAWRLRLAAAINRSTPQRAIDGLASTDHCWIVRAAAGERHQRCDPRQPLDTAVLREECLPRSARSRLKEARLCLARRDDCVDPEAIRRIWSDREIMHFAVGGVLSLRDSHSLGAQSPLHSLTRWRRRSSIVRAIGELNRTVQHAAAGPI
jgi:hypothetical protein